MPIITLNDQNFEDEVLKSDNVALVDFWATWCPPCKIIGPFVEKLAEEYEGKAKICKLNVDEGRQTAMAHRIEVIPTLIIFKQGKIVDTIIGAVPYEVLAQKVEQHI